MTFADLIAKAIAKATPVVRQAWSIAVGGATGALEGYFQQQGVSLDLSHLDWHKIGQLALAGAVLAFVFHRLPPPQKQPPADAGSPGIPKQ